MARLARGLTVHGGTGRLRMESWAGKRRKAAAASMCVCAPLIISHVAAAGTRLCVRWIRVRVIVCGSQWGYR